VGYARYARRVVWGMLGILGELFGSWGCAYESKMGHSIMNCEGRWCAHYYPDRVY
jgi:hypothetical protein